MNKSDLITILAEKENLPKGKASAIVNLIFDEFKNTLKKDQRVDIRGFVNFSVRKYRAHMGRNFKIREQMWVGAKKSVCFKVGKRLREKIEQI